MTRSSTQADSSATPVDFSCGLHEKQGDAELDLKEVTRARVALEHITNKWAVLILTVLCRRPARFNEIMRRLDGITHKALADALKRLQRNGLITRRVLTASPIGVEYAITELGHSLREPFQALYDWTLVYGPALEDARREFDAAHDDESR
ncbi:winged helix-turn-helix transcriptional regulator [Salinisphaera hydrothermalis]|uniref:winged helix-turn-helix transcriptional regulator n=1 Tax=Salinisphaera hydrothermalis TaxID=563188 RepID=UPI0033407953